MANNKQPSIQSNEFVDYYQLPQYEDSFLKLVDDAQWLLLQAISPVVASVANAHGDSILPESFMRSTSSASTNKGEMSPRIIEAPLEFKISPIDVSSGNYEIVIDQIAPQLTGNAKAMVPNFLQSLSDQGAAVEGPADGNFWDRLNEWLETQDIEFSDDGKPLNIKIVGHSQDLSKLPEQTHEQKTREREIFESKRREFNERKSEAKRSIAPLGQQLNEDSGETGHTDDTDSTSDSLFMDNYQLPSYFNAQFELIQDALIHEFVSNSPILALWKALYQSHGLRTAGSASGQGGTLKSTPTEFSVDLRLPREADISGDYGIRLVKLKEYATSVKDSQIQIALKSIQSTAKAFGAHSGVTISESFSWDTYIDEIETMSIEFSEMGAPLNLPVLMIGNYDLPEMTNEQHERLRKILSDKRRN